MSGCLTAKKHILFTDLQACVGVHSMHKSQKEHINLDSKNELKKDKLMLLLRNGHICPRDIVGGYEALLMLESRCLTMAESLLGPLLCWDMGLCHDEITSVWLI